jgi:purine-binding chemotaxis protein CheW
MNMDHPAEQDQLVTVWVGEQLFGLPIHLVRDVFIASDMTFVPLAPRAVSGLFNLRGRIITMLSLRAFLNLEPCGARSVLTAVGVDWRGETLGLLVDKVGEVMTLPSHARESNPANLDRRWSALSRGIYQLDEGLLVELNLEMLFSHTLNQAA